jgi:hypothetical protein
MQYRKLKAYGQLPELYVDAEPIREHVWKLRNSGMTIKEIAMLSGVGINSIMNLTTGRPRSQRNEGRLPKDLKKVSKVNAERLLSLSPKGESNE